jgi:hypothetical protein
LEPVGFDRVPSRRVVHRCDDGTAPDHDRTDISP